VLVDKKSNHTKKSQLSYRQLSPKNKRNGKKLHFEHKHYAGTSYTFQAHRRGLLKTLSSFPSPWPSSALQMRPLGFQKAITSFLTANKYLK